MFAFHRLATGLLAVGYERYGNEDKLTHNAIMHLFDVYVKVNKDVKEELESGKSETDLQAKEYFRKMEDGDWPMFSGHPKRR
jgi:arginyl-tRNA synthetase